METLLFFALGLTVLSFALMHKHQLAFAGFFNDDDDTGSPSLAQRMKSFILKSSTIIHVKEGDDGTMEPPNPPASPTEYPRNYQNGGAFCKVEIESQVQSEDTDVIVTFLTNEDNVIALCTYDAKTGAGIVNRANAPLNLDQVQEIRIYNKRVQGWQNFTGDLYFLKANGEVSEGIRVDGTITSEAIREAVGENALVG